MIQWDPEKGYYEDGSDAASGGGAPAPFVQPSLDPSQSDYHGIDYWGGQGERL